MESTLEGATRGRKRAYSPRNRLRRDMVSGHPVFELFVSGSSTGSDKLFHCMICQRDVSMESRGPAEFARHFFGKRHWVLDVSYRVQNDMPVFNRLMDPMVLTEAQLSEYRDRPRKGKSEGFSFPEDLLPACTQANSSVPLMTMINCLVELLRSSGSYTLLWRLWGSFRATLGRENPLYSLNWSLAESLVSLNFPVLFSAFDLYMVVLCWCLLEVIGSNFRHFGIQFLVCVLVDNLPCAFPSGIAVAHFADFCIS